MKRYIIEEREGDSCDGCMFDGAECIDAQPASCSSTGRDDGLNIIFVMVKIEEIDELARRILASVAEYEIERKRNKA